MALDDPSVTDTMVEDVLCQSGPLEPDASLACTGSYTITQDDLDVGSVTDTAVGEGTYGSGESVASDEVSLTVTALAPDGTGSPALTLQSQADPTTYGAVGEVISYTYLLTNTGGVALDDPSVTDTMVEDVLCQSGPLELDASLACTGSYTITQDDLDVGSVTDTAVGEGTYGSGESVASDEVSLTVTPLAPDGTGSPALTLQSQADPTTYGAVGEVISYTYLLTNTGGVALDDPSVTDTMVGTCSASRGPSSLMRPSPARAPTPSPRTTSMWARSRTPRWARAPRLGRVGRLRRGQPDRHLLRPDGARGPDARDAGRPDDLQRGRREHRLHLRGDQHRRRDPRRGVRGRPRSGTVPCPSEPLEPGGSATAWSRYRITQDDLDAGSVTITSRATARPATARRSPPTRPA